MDTRPHETLACSSLASPSDRCACTSTDSKNGSGQPSVVLGPGDSVATPATDTPTDSGENSTDKADAEYTDASTEEAPDDYRQFATSVLNRSENTVELHTVMAQQWPCRQPLDRTGG